MSHQDPRVRALIRADKALKAAGSHMRHAGDDIDVRDLRKDLAELRRNFAQYIAVVR